MTKLLPFAAQGAAPIGLRDGTALRPARAMEAYTAHCSVSGPDSAVSSWVGGDLHCIRQRRLSVLSVTCSSRKVSRRPLAGGRHSVLEKRNKTLSSSKRKSDDGLRDANSWSAGETVTALEPREEELLPLVGLYSSNSGRVKYADAKKSLEKPDNTDNVDRIAGNRPSPQEVKETVSERRDKVDGAEEWVEVDDEEWERSLKDHEEDVELVEVWEGDLPPMTAEEEAALLLEAEAEIFQIEKERREKDRRATHGAASSTFEQEVGECSSPCAPHSSASSVRAAFLYAS